MQTGPFQITMFVVWLFLEGLGSGKYPYNLLTNFWNYWFSTWTQWDSLIISIIGICFSCFYGNYFVHTFKIQIRTPGNHAGTQYSTWLWFSYLFHSCYLPEHILLFHFHKTTLFTADTLSSIWDLHKLTSVHNPDWFIPLICPLHC